MNSAAELKDFCAGTAELFVHRRMQRESRLGLRKGWTKWCSAILSRSTPRQKYRIVHGYPLERMAVWTPGEENELPDDVKIVLWHGFCSVHKRFTVPQIEAFRTEHPDGVVVVHPECPMEVVQAADANGKY